MKKKIQEVYDYFKGKIIKGQFKPVSIDEHKATISVADRIFHVWISNEDYGLETLSTSFMYISFSDEEKKKVWSKLKNVVEDHKRNVLLVQKKAELEKLKKELGED